MLGKAAVEVEAASTWAPVNQRGSQPDWQAVDRALRALAARRAELDADEAHWLREAEALQIWRPLGMVSALDYLERVFGYAPRTAQDRLRVARALGSLPQLTAALSSGELPFSAVRELTRVATPATEASWVAAAIGKNVRQIEELVADHRPGDGPEDPPDPKARTHVVRFELSAETFALLRQTRSVLDDEHGQNLSEDQFVAALCHAVLDGAPTAEPSGRAKFQVAVTVCERCRQGWQEGAGAKIAIGSAAVERAMCDAQHIGSIDGDAPERAYQDIPPSVVRFVWRRDGGRCRIDSCRSARGLELHHIVHRANGGSHDPSNLVLACSACHSAHHTGTLTISGTADHLDVRRPAMRRSITEAGAHMDARNDSRLVAEAGAQMDTPSVPHQAAEASAHMGAPSDSRRVAAANAHMGAPSEPRTVAEIGTDMSARSGPHLVQEDAHTGARRTPNPVVEEDAHMNARRESNSAVEISAHMGTRSGSNSVTETDSHKRARSRLNVAVLRTQSKEALVGLGWKPAIATAAVAAASAALGTEVTLERLIFEALRRCPRPTA
jgi:hypothetical protein